MRMRMQRGRVKTPSDPIPAPYRLLLDEARCYPQPACQDAMSCARYLHSEARMAMNPMPYRAEGEPCAWYIRSIREAA